MAYSTDAWTGAVTPNGDENVDVAADLVSFKNSIRPRLVPHFATPTDARNTADALITADPDVRLVCTVETHSSAFYCYGADGWELVGNVTPTEYAFGTGLSPVFSLSSSWAAFTTGTYTFTPTSTGWATIGYDFDVSRITANFSAAYVRAKFNNGSGSVNIGDNSVLFDSTPRASGQWRAWKRVRIESGVACTAAVDVSSFSTGSNQWQLNNFVWHIVHQ